MATSSAATCPCSPWARVRADPQRGASDRTVDCIADWYEHYATDEQRSAFRAGGPITASSAGPAGSKAEAAMIECIRLAL